MTQFVIEPDIRVAETLPAHFYTDPGNFEHSKERIFARTWQFAAVLSGSNNIVPFTLLEGCLDEPLVITRGDGRLRCLSNVCTHRGKVICEAPCRGGGLKCGYHGRRFDLAGRFLSMPEFESTLDFPTGRDDLAEIQVAAWRDLAFVALDPVAPAASFFAEVNAGTSGLYETEPRFAGSREYEVAAHWALYCENYLEGFHVPYVHPGLNRAIDYATYRTETYRFSSLQTATGHSNTFDGNAAAYYFFVFPNLMLNFYPWGISVNIVRPLAPDRTKVTYLTFVADGSKLGAGAGGDLDSVELEDQAVVASVQRGIASRYYDRGRYSPTREQGTHHFHRLVAEFMSL
jgi:choline monooxygenase